MRFALKYNEELKEAGFTTEESKAVLHIWGEIMESQLVTKEEFKSETSKIRSEIKDLGTELRSEMKDLEIRLTLRLGLIMMAGVSLLGLINQWTK